MSNYLIRTLAVFGVFGACVLVALSPDATNRVFFVALALVLALLAAAQEE